MTALMGFFSGGPRTDSDILLANPGPADLDDKLGLAQALHYFWHRVELQIQKETAMGIQLKPVNEQVVVITGASSGIGLATAETAAQRGAKVVLAARSIDTLEEVAARLTDSGGGAIAVECDVADRGQVQTVADKTIGASAASIPGSITLVSERMECCRKRTSLMIGGYLR